MSLSTDTDSASLDAHARAAEEMKALRAEIRANTFQVVASLQAFGLCRLLVSAGFWSLQALNGDAPGTAAAQLPLLLAGADAYSLTEHRVPDRRGGAALVANPMKPMSTTFEAFRPSPLLADIVEVIWVWDVPDADAAKALAIQAPPATSLFLVAQYRAPLRSDWHLGSQHRSVSPHEFFAIQGQTGVVITQPKGPLGLLKVCLKPETASHILGAPMQDFADTRVELCNIFGKSELAMLQDRLSMAQDSRERVAAIEAFLVAKIRDRHAVQDCVARHAALLLQRDPGLTVHQLASDLDISERGLQRQFKAAFGTSPKRFASLARFEMAVAERLSGRAWPDIAYGCGFADQAHMIREFKRVAGQPPDSLFSNLSACAGGLMQFYRPANALASRWREQCRGQRQRC